MKAVPDTRDDLAEGYARVLGRSMELPYSAVRDLRRLSSAPEVLPTYMAVSGQ